MRHGRRTKKLGRTASHRRATLGNLATSLFEHGSLRTTEAKAKELRRVAERMITFAKRGDLHARRQVLRRIQNKVVVSKLFGEIGPGFADRNGGYTRILKLGSRRGDRTEICLIELVGKELRADYASRSATRATRRKDAAGPSQEAPATPAAASSAQNTAEGGSEAKETEEPKAGS